MSLRPIPHAVHESTPNQNERAFRLTTAAVKDCVAICRANDVPLTALGVVVDLYRDQLRAVVFGDDLKADELRNRLIAKIEAARGDSYGHDLVAPVVRVPSARAGMPSGGNRPDLFSMTDDELAAEAKRLGIE